ncbi:MULTISPECIES: chorismate mutase [Metabacillus]|uniref:chorismate mutase n=3 Tax=Metabacillus TaxID=2675233 RepID=A0A179SWX9_9BACI|nr:MULTISPECIES: chorismate mutase [Metabacillus]OAS86336.1 chorismate mutase [Metabacillus litoralis]QNF30671.1 chorismate mutase [Metabacillus sp. KUDC1714]
MIRGIRGATTVIENKEDVILKATEELIHEMIRKNDIRPENVAQVIMTVTEDLTATFPAKALRTLRGWTYVPVMCMKEIPVPNSLGKCIRIMMTVETNEKQENIHHVYLEEAVKLRPDLSII